MARKILALDIDGTLTNSRKEISPRTLDRLMRIQKMGHILVLASGRPTYGLRMAATALELERYGGYLLSYNGGFVQNQQTGEVVFERRLPPSLIPELYDFAAERGVGLLTYEDDHILTGLPHDPYTKLEARINAMPIRDVENFVQAVTFPVHKCLITAPADRAPGLEKELCARYGSSLSIYRSEPFFIEVMPAKVDKALSLDRLLKRLGMSVSDIIACGDGFNDVSMIRFAGLGVAMMNAQESVKKEADFVTLSNDEDGVAYVVEKFLLGA